MMCTILLASTVLEFLLFQIQCARIFNFSHEFKIFAHWTNEEKEKEKKKTRFNKYFPLTGNI